MMEALSARKSEGDAAFREGRLEEACALYTAALEEDGPHVPTLCNRSLAALKLGRPEVALADAEAALEALALQAETAAVPPPPSAQLAKAFHRKAEALIGLGRLLDAIRTYRQGLAACGGSPELHAALRLAAEELPVSWLAKYWAAHVEAAQAPHPLSSRDGRLIKPVPHGERLPPPDLQAQLEAALRPLQDEARDLLCAAWSAGRRPGKAEAAFFRGAAYLAAGSPGQALKDARFALAYGPRLDDAVASGSAGASGQSDVSSAGELVPAGGAAAGAGAAGEPVGGAAAAASAWPAALALLSGAHEGLADNVPAALAMARAHELDPENEDYSDALERLMRRIPEPCAAALQAGGAAGLAAHLSAEKEAAKPEFLRKRPKYYYYYEWMKKRIAQQYPALPEPVMDKMLALEANELDMVLQYPAATRATVERLMGVYEEGGAQALEGYSVPLLSWDDYQAIREGGSLPALEAAPAGALATGRLLEAGEGASQCRTASHGGTGSGAGAAPKGEASGSDAASEVGSIDVEDVDELAALD